MKYLARKLQEKLEQILVNEMVRVTQIFRKTGCTVKYKWWINPVCWLEFKLRNYCYEKPNEKTTY